MLATSTAAETGARLDRIERSLDRVERALTGLAAVAPPAAQLVHDGPRLAAMATDIVDDALADMPDADARLRALLRFALRVSRPETLDALTAGLDLIDNAPHGVAAAVDMFDAVMAQAAAEGVDVSAFFGVATRFGMHLVKLGPAIDRLLDSGMLDPDAIDTLGRVGRALAHQTAEPPPPAGGLFSLLGALKDPDVRQALGFALGLARRFGAETRSTQHAVARR